MKKNDTKKQFPVLNINPSDIAKYYLYRSNLDGDLITPLKMQKLVYLAYATHLAKEKKRLFSEKIEAWPNGPVVPSLYRELSKYGFSPIEQEYLGSTTEDKLTHKFRPRIKKVLDDVYEEYAPRSAFELVMLTHQQKSWLEARKGLKENELTNNVLDDSLIVEQLGER